MKTVYDKTAMLQCTDNDKLVEAEIDNFQPNKSLDAFVATNKIHMRWNGSVYVGNAHGMEFTTPGPDSHNVNLGRMR